MCKIRFILGRCLHSSIPVIYFSNLMLHVDANLTVYVLELYNRGFICVVVALRVVMHFVLL